MLTAVQYYRPPFPEQRFWAGDLSAIRDAGLDGIQLWCIWGWIEGVPGTFKYDDYDALVTGAGERGLKVVLSTVAEIQPFWIHRLVPNAELVDHLARKVVSGPRSEVNVGLTPGGCFDHPEVAGRMRRFLENIGSRYGGADHVAGWDCWNETRWNVHANGLTCYCVHTLTSFRSWLRGRYGGLEGLNAAWKRRYTDWEDVWPGRRTGGPYCDLIDFGRFQSARTTQHARFRYDCLRRGGAAQPITAHGPMPTIVTPPVTAEVPMCRGNDWELADVLDGVGSSHFPISEGMSESLVGARIQQVASAAQGKETWTSEIQGSSSSIGYGRAGRRGGPLKQQQWLFRCMARGYKTTIFWQWRDESFCGEAGTGGMSGQDGLASARLAALGKALSFAATNEALLDAFRPDPPRVGVLFNPESFYLTWARQGNVDDARWSVTAYGMALERLRIPYAYVEAHHTSDMDDLDVLLVPWCQMLPDTTRTAIDALFARGGRILVEAETDAYDANGFYRHPAERPLMRAIGMRDIGRRPLPSGGILCVELERTTQIPLLYFTTPLEGSHTQVLSRNTDGEPLLVRCPVANGAAYVIGGFAGRAYFEEPTSGLEALVRHVCENAGVVSDAELDVGNTGDSGLTWRTGMSGTTRLLWITNTDDGTDYAVTFTLRRDLFPGCDRVTELVRNESVEIDRSGDCPRLRLTVPAGCSAVLSA